MGVEGKHDILNVSIMKTDYRETIIKRKSGTHGIDKGQTLKNENRKRNFLSNEYAGISDFRRRNERILWRLTRKNSVNISTSVILEQRNYSVDNKVTYPHPLFSSNRRYIKRNEYGYSVVLFETM